jgi:hypothetical protein
MEPEEISLQFHPSPEKLVKKILSDIYTVGMVES